MPFFGIVVACFATLVTACSNPKCWTHDSIEVSGGCSLGGSSGDTSGHFDSEAYRRDNERLLAAYLPACTRGEPLACWMVGLARTTLDRPAPETEAAFAVACRGGLGVVPGGDTTVCDQAALSAVRSGERGRARQHAYLELACLRGSAEGCRFVFQQASSPPTLELAEAACWTRVAAGCAAAARATTDPERRRAFVFRGCKFGDAAMCAELGRGEVAP